MFKQKEQKSNPFGGGDETTGKGTLERKAPESSGILKDIDNALKTKDTREETFERYKKRILERCGC